MNRVTLTELQRLQGYPSITLLVNTTPGTPLSLLELDTARRLVIQADDRLDGDVSDTLRLTLISRLTDLIDEQAPQASAQALALFVSLAHDGRVATLVVEGGFMLPARIDENHQLHPADDPHHPEVNDDIVDDTIETVLLHGGNVIVVNDGALDEHQHIAAVLRY